MSEPSSPPAAPSPQAPGGPPPPPDGTVEEHTEGLQLDIGGEESVDRKLAQIEMAGEEVAAGWKPSPHQPLSPEVRYLHVSRTIHQLITDRNRTVGIFLAVASLSFAASTALLNAHADVVPIVPLRALQYWCLPVTFGTLAAIGTIMCLILVRTRIGLIYEVAKMNALLGLPAERVKRVNPLSIFFLMYLMVCLCAGASLGLATAMIIGHEARNAAFLANPGAGGVSSSIAAGQSTGSVMLGVLIGLGYTAAFLAIYYAVVLGATTGARLDKASG